MSLFDIVKRALGSSKESGVSRQSAVLVNWNIRSGGGRRVPQILKALERHRSDIVVLTEFWHQESGNQLISGLRSLGMEHHVACPAPERTNTVLIASRYAIAPARNICIPPDLQNMVIAGETAGVTIVGAFCREKPYADQFVRFLVDTATTLSGGVTLATGDFNLGAHESCDGQHGEERKLNKALQAGWVDTWRRDNQGKTDWSHQPSRGMRTRPDHLFALRDSSKFVSNVKFSQAEMLEKHSDHAPLIATVTRGGSE